MDAPLRHALKDHIFRTLQRGSIEEVKHVVTNLEGSQRELLHEVEGHGWNPAHFAAKRGSVELLQLLHAAGVSLTQPSRDNNAMLPLHLACHAGSTSAVKFLLAHGSEARVVDQFSDGVGHEHQQNSMIGIRDGLGNTALTYAALESHVELFDVLLDAGADVHVVDKRGFSLLHLAAAVGNLWLARTAVEQNVDVDGRTTKGELTPMMLAAQAGHIAVVAYLLTAGASLDSTDDHGFTPLHWASASSETASVSLLHIMGANAAVVSDSGDNALHIACKADKHAAIDYLVAHAPHLARAKNDEGEEPLALLRDFPLLVAQSRSVASVVRLARAARRRDVLFSAWFLRGLVAGFNRGKRSDDSAVAAYLPLTVQPLCLYVTIDDLAIGSHVVRSHHLPTLHALCILQFAAMFFYLVTWWRGPGSVDPDNASRRREYFEAIQKLAAEPPRGPDGKAATKKGLPQSCCQTCHIVKPPRSKHCKVCDKCVLMMDHHCAFMRTCIGQRNYFYFALYLGSVLASAALFVVLAVTELFYETRPEVLVMAVICAAGLVAVGQLACYQGWLVSKGLLANEAMNWDRYPHLQDANKRFKNIFDRGLWTNIRTRCCPRTSDYEKIFSVKASRCCGPTETHLEIRPGGRGTVVGGPPGDSNDDMMDRGGGDDDMERDADGGGDRVRLINNGSQHDHSHSHGRES